MSVNTLDKSLASQLPSHLSSFDAFNVATEMRTHTDETSRSSNAALDKMANTLLFDREYNYVASSSRFGHTISSSWTDPDEAFIGQ